MSVQGYIDPNFPNPMGPNDASIIIYGYTPSLALGILGVVLFSIATAIHLWLLLRYRTWYFTPIIVGTIMEVIGYVFRLLSNQLSPYSVSWFVAQYFCIVVAPVFFSAAIYTLASVIINICGRQHTLLRPKVVLWGFIGCDVVATITQVAGAALVGTAYSNQKDPTTPNNILLAGLAFQSFTFAVFLVVLLWTLVRSKGRLIHIDKGFLVALIIATLAVYLRTVFRLAETAEGLMGRLSTHEVFFGCLEFLPIVVAVFIFTYWHPGRWLKATVVEDNSATVAAKK